MCKGLRPLKVNCPKGKRSWPGPCAFNQHVFSNFFKSLKIRTAWRKDFFDTLRGGHTGRPYGPALGFPVGADCISARSGFRFAAGFDASSPALTVKKPPRKLENPSRAEKRLVPHAENAPPVIRRRVCCVANYRRFSSRIQAAQTFFPL